MRYLLMSDTHGELQRALSAVREAKDIDAYFHLGDVGFDEQYMPSMHIACGNHDRHKYPKEILMTLAGHKALLIHGDRYEFEIMNQMKKNPTLWKSWDDCMNILYDSIASDAKKKGFDIVLFGHTHTAHFEKRHGVWLCNPGSLCFSHNGAPPSYAVLEIQGKNVQCEFHYIQDEDE